LLLAAPLALFASCASEWYGYSYMPMPLEVPVQAADQPQLSGRALVTVLGIHRPVSSESRPASIDLRVRLENYGALPFVPVPASFKLVTAGLEEFDQAQFIDLPTVPIEKGGSATFQVSFPLTPGRGPDSYGLAGLNLRWDVEFAGRVVGCSASFQLYVPPPPYSSWGFGVGVGFAGEGCQVGAAPAGAVAIGRLE
jgi:hypothetical protein